MAKKLVITDSPTIRKKVYKHVREQILRGEIGPNERLIEAKIAAEIGTSRTPVREALHSLEIEGLVESLPRIGYMVKAISDQEVVELWEIRFLIEGLAVRWAMEKARDRLIKELKKNIEAAEKMVAGGDVSDMADVDAQFHEVIARLSGGKRLLELSQTLRRHALRYRIESMYLPDTAIRAIEGHKAILDAVEKGDTEAVNAALKRHLDQSKADTLRYAFKEEHDI
ncbi:MAG TPA: GntR family transcriptional regulator [Syntrophorhabdaceae bacterium]|jgi:DNA-binding GntR family transcriptional regulator